MILSAVRDPYPTRDKSEGALIRRAEPVVHQAWSENAPLSKEQVAEFERTGVLVLTDVFSAHELNILRAASERLAMNRDKLDPARLLREAESDELRTLFGVHDLDNTLKQTAEHPHIVEMMQFLLNDEVYIHQSRLNFKSPQYGSGFEWHSDFETWHAEDGMPGMRAISATILLTDEISADGSLKYMPGSHKTFVACPGETPEAGYKQNLRTQAVGKPPALLLDLLEESNGIEELTAPAGSVVLFDCNVMHGAGKNTTDLMRANLFFVYNAVSNALNSPYEANQTRPAFLAERQIKPLAAPEIA